MCCMQATLRIIIEQLAHVPVVSAYALFYIWNFSNVFSILDIIMDDVIEEVSLEKRFEICKMNLNDSAIN